jgi:hypothetical protein
LQKLETVQNTGMILIGRFAKTTPIHAMAAITANPGHRRDWMAKKEVSKSIFKINPLGKQLKKLLGNKTKMEKHLSVSWNELQGKK